MGHSLTVVEYANSMGDDDRMLKIKTSGQGLPSMKNRAETLGGDYRFYYDEGYKTSVNLPMKV